jgi:Flp pilus assembly pilin Flp
MYPSEDTGETALKRPSYLGNVLKARLPTLLKDSRGQGLVEYLLMVALVAFACVAALQIFACRVNCALETVTNQLERVFTNSKKIPPGQIKKCSKKCD